MRRLRGLAFAFRWPFIGMLAAVTILLGIVGFERQFAILGADRTVFDSAYKTLQLFVLEWGGVDEPVPTALQIARFAAPLVAGLAAAKAVAVIFRVELERLWVRLFGRGHVVVCGQGERGWRLSAALRGAGWRVAGIDLVEPTRPVTDWALILGDATDAETLRRAAVHRARHLVALCPDDTTNIAVARQGRLHGGQKLQIHVLTTSPDLAALLRSETYRTHADSAPLLEFFSLEDRGAMLLLQRVLQTPDALAAIGNSPLVDRVVHEARRRWPDARIDSHPSDPPTVASRLLGTRSVVLVTDGPHGDGVTSALRLVQEMKELGFGNHGGTVDVFALGAAARHLADLVAEGYGPHDAIRLHAFDLQEEVLTSELLTRTSRESIARAIHEAYRGAPSPRGTLGAWEELAESDREASRAAADATRALLRTVGCDLVAARPGGGDVLRLLPSEVELMALLEHDRWLQWFGGTPADHPHHLPWFDLPEVVRERTQEVVRRLPQALHDVGQRVVRLDQSPARALHEAYMASREARGETPETNPSLVAWDRLPITLQDSNRDQVAHLRVKLRSIGLDLAEGAGESLPIPDKALEHLAELEHERWVRHRRFDGWTLGDHKDTEARVSPYLVPWSKLDEATRETDRVFVRAIPETVALLGGHIVRAEP